MKNFVVERRLSDGVFSAIDSVTARNHADVSEAYNVIDRQPASGLNYYRLRIVQGSGEFAYSDIKMVRWKTTKQPNVFPNPVRSATFNVQAGSDKIIGVKIFDTQLRQVKSLFYNSGEQNGVVEVGSLLNGIYIVEVRTLSERYKYKISVQR